MKWPASPREVPNLEKVNAYKGQIRFAPFCLARNG